MRQQWWRVLYEALRPHLAVHTDSLWETQVQGSSQCLGVFYLRMDFTFPCCNFCRDPKSILNKTLVTVSAFRSCTAQSALIALVFFSSLPKSLIGPVGCVNQSCMQSSQRSTLLTGNWLHYQTKLRGRAMDYTRHVNYHTILRALYDHSSGILHYPNIWFSSAQMEANKPCWRSQMEPTAAVCCSCWENGPCWPTYLHFAAV